MSAFEVAVVAAERGGFVRAAPLLAELRARRECRPQFVFAGEEYAGYATSELFHDLGLPYADGVIGASEGTRAERLAKVMIGCERIAASLPSGAVVLVGQSHTMLACAIACARTRAVIAHADAGLRLPGLAGRTGAAAQIDRAVGLRLAVSEAAHDRLLDEGAAEDRVVLTGALACDAVLACIERARASDIVSRAELERKGFALAVVEAPTTIDHIANLNKLVGLLARVQDELPVALCVHRRLAQRLEAWQLAEAVAELPRLFKVEARGYVEFLSLLDSARFVLTDVGGVQDEATFLGVPCLTLADATDHVATVECSNNVVVGLDAELAMQAVTAVMKNEYPQGASEQTEPTEPRRAALPAAWDGRAAARVVDALLQAA